MNPAAVAIGGRLETTRQRLRDYLELTKPRLSALVLLTTATGGWLGARSHHELGLLWVALAGTALCAGGANALNQWMEREQDARMQRTQDRPVPAGRLRAEEAWRVGAGLAVSGLCVLAAVNGLTALLAAVCLGSYLLVYTPLKRATPLCTLVGAVPGAIPPMMGWTAMRNALGPEAWVLFGLLFVWQLPHFLALATLYREDYARAGFNMLPLAEPQGLATARHIALYGLVLVPMSLTPTLVRLAGETYFYGALLLSLGFLAACVRAALRRNASASRQLFLASVLYLPGLLALLAVDKWPGL